MKALIVSVFLVFAFLGLDFLGSIHVFEPVEAGDVAEIHVNVKNPTGQSFDDVVVRAYALDISDLGITADFDLDRYERNGFWLEIPVPENAPKGDNLYKITVSSDEIYDSQYIYINVR